MEQETSANLGPGVRWGEWISEGWLMFVEKWQVWMGQMLVVFAVFAIPAAPFFLMIFALLLRAWQAGRPPELPDNFFPLATFIALMWLLGGAFFWGGLYRTAFKQLRGEPITVRDLFSGGDIFLPVAGAFIVVYLLTVLGFFLLILPALVVAGMMHFTIPLIVERKLSLAQAISASYNATRADWLLFALFVFALGLLASVGGMACYIGLVASYPLYFTVTVIAYRDVFGMTGARSFPNQQPSRPPYVEPLGALQPQVPFPAPSQSERTLVICAKCGTGISKAARFCNKCGNPVRNR